MGRLGDQRAEGVHPRRRLAPFLDRHHKADQYEGHCHGHVEPGVATLRRHATPIMLRWLSQSAQIIWRQLATTTATRSMGTMLPALTARFCPVTRSRSTCCWLASPLVASMTWFSDLVGA